MGRSNKKPAMNKGILQQMSEAGEAHDDETPDILKDIRGAIFDTSMKVGHRSYMIVHVEDHWRLVRITRTNGPVDQVEIQNITNENYRKPTKHERAALHAMFNPEG